MYFPYSLYFLYYQHRRSLGIRLSTLKNLMASNVYKNVQNVMQMALKSFFFKLQKIAQRLGALPFIPSLVIRLKYTNLFNTSLKLNIFRKYFLLLVQVFPFSKILVTWQPRPQLLILHSNTSLSLKKFLFSKTFNDVIACDLWFGPPQKSCIRLWISDAPSLEVDRQKRMQFERMESKYGVNCSAACWRSFLSLFRIANQFLANF